MLLDRRFITINRSFIPKLKNNFNKVLIIVSAAILIILIMISKFIWKDKKIGQ